MTVLGNKGLIFMLAFSSSVANKHGNESLKKKKMPLLKTNKFNEIH